MAVAITSLLSVKAISWDTQHRLPYTPHRTMPKKPQNPKSVSSTTPALTPTTPVKPVIDAASVLTLLSRKVQPTVTEKLEQTYLGLDTWLPSAPKVEKPRSAYNAASLAYLGDCIYELYARRHFLFPPLNIEEYNDRVMAVVRCEAQDAMLKKLLTEDFFSKEEREILRWGKSGGGSAKTRTKKRVGVAAYNRASSLETLVGYLYMTNVKRLEEVMSALGFSAIASPN